MRSSRNHRRGFLFIEILMAIVILAIAAEIGIQLVRSSLRYTHDAITQQEAMVRQSAALNQLRADVLQSRTLTGNGIDSVTIDDHVRWTSDSNGLHRIEDANHRDWLGVLVSLSIQNAHLLVRPIDSPNAVPERFVSLNQWMNEVSR